MKNITRYIRITPGSIIALLIAGAWTWTLVASWIDPSGLGFAALGLPILSFIDFYFILFVSKLVRTRHPLAHSLAMFVMPPVGLILAIVLITDFYGPGADISTGGGLAICGTTLLFFVIYTKEARDKD